MDMNVQAYTALYRTIGQLLRPLVRVLLRHNVSFHAFEQLARRAYVDVALRDFRIPGKKPSISRASILSGLSRKEVQRLLSAPQDAEVGEGERYNRAARVLTAWTRDADFVDSRGEPRVLDTDAGGASFAELVKRHSGDTPVRAVLDELLRVGAVNFREDGGLELAARAFVPTRSAVDKIAILGMDVADLIETIDHNIEHGDSDPRFQRKVMYDGIPVSMLPEFRKLGAAQAQSLLEKLDRWLAAHDTESPVDAPPDAPRARVGVGIFYFEERLDPPVP